jgi:hypothetical protein
VPSPGTGPDTRLAAAHRALLLLFALSGQPAWAPSSTEVVAVEVVRAVVGSMEIVLDVPFTTFVAARLVGRGEPMAGGTTRSGSPAGRSPMAQPVDPEAIDHR